MLDLDFVRDEPESGSPFHPGETAVQTRVGVEREVLPWARRVVRPFLPEEHRTFYAQLPYLVVAARDDAGRPWATLLAGRPGFVTAPDPRTLAIDAAPSPGDALAGALSDGRDVGLLGIELHSRRRNRANGRVQASGGGLTVAVEQAFGNCPQFIHARRWREVEVSEGPRSRRYGRDLPRHLVALIERADTFFIATGHRAEGEHESYGMDASHRGGAPGFIKLERTPNGERCLVFPDYPGNNHFNTLGNLALDARAGITIVDFERGDLLQLSGRAVVDWSEPDPALFPGAHRVVRFALEEATELRGVLPLRFEAPAAETRELRVVAKQRESEDVMSIFFESRDGSQLPSWRAGQHLPIALDLPGSAGEVTRTYSLSAAPGDSAYRISVKREPEGLVSRFLHDELQPGDRVRAGRPAGNFVLEEDASRRPIVFVAGGIGVTPLLSMLHALVEAQSTMPIYFVLGARDGRHAALEAEIGALVGELERARLHVLLSRPAPGDLQQAYRSHGRVDAAVLGEVQRQAERGSTPDADADFYLCGPPGFLGSIEQDLESLGVAPERVHSESFGG